jgi:hypothetical protein
MMLVLQIAAGILLALAIRWLYQAGRARFLERQIRGLERVASQMDEALWSDWVQTPEGAPWKPGTIQGTPEFDAWAHSPEAEEWLAWSNTEEGKQWTQISQTEKGKRSALESVIAFGWKKNPAFMAGRRSVLEKWRELERSTKKRV